MEEMNNYRNAARMFGMFFILTFLSYGIGSGLIQSIVTVPDFLSNVYSNQVQIIDTNFFINITRLL